MRLKAVLVLVTALGLCLGFPSYTGYSGAPGSSGTCAGTCHGSGGGTITVSGFPSTYTPGQAYTITVAHNGGSSIENFNASVRIGTGSTNAGVLAAGTNTAEYDVSGETNGIHFGTSGQESGTFTWTAPSPSVGPVKLYLAGHQGAASGPNTEIVLTAGSGVGVAEPANPARVAPTFTVEPSVARTALLLRAGNLSHSATVRVINSSGRCVERFSISAGDVALAWPLFDHDGRRLPAGVYHAVLTSGRTTIARRFVVAKD